MIMFVRSSSVIHCQFHRRLLVMVLLGTSIALLYYSHTLQNRIYLIKTEGKSFISRSFLSLAGKPVCEIPSIDPLDKRYRHLTLPAHIMTCSASVSLTYQNGSYLIVNNTAVNLMASENSFSFCQYETVYRPRSGKDHDYFQYLKISAPFKSSARVDSEFVRVRCYDNDNNTLQTNFYAFVFQKPENSVVRYIERREELMRNKPNVLMLGLDSVSRWNSMRYLTRTRRILQALQATEMKGYSILGHNTFKNLVPMLSGSTETELGWNRSKWWIPFDKYGFIWKKFKQKGFVTFYAEDKADISLFDFNKVGFRRFPTDYFNRHLSVAIQKERETGNIDEFCIGDRTEADIILDYQLQFMRRHVTVPTFSFIFLTQITHDYPEYAGSMDIIVSHYLDKLHRYNLLDNTYLFLFGDHGMRWGHIRTSEIGYTEMKLPMMFILLPKSDRLDLSTHLLENSARLSTPYDVYETLNAILGLPRKGRFGISFLSSIPGNRSCTEAGIPDDCCVCKGRYKIPVTKTLRRLVNRTVLPEINKILQPYWTKCLTLKLKTVSRASKHVINSTRAFEVVFETVPGNALFQAEIRKMNKSSNFEISGEIIRINRYGDQSHCIQDYFVKNFCLCKDLKFDEV